MENLQIIADFILKCKFSSGTSQDDVIKLTMQAQYDSVQNTVSGAKTDIPALVHSAAIGLGIAIELPEQTVEEFAAELQAQGIGKLSEEFREKISDFLRSKNSKK
jgi:hypothetical protein